MVYNNVKELLEKEDKTRYWLVKKLESSYPVVDSILNNETKSMNFDTMEKLCKIFNCTPNELFTIEFDEE